MKTETHTFKILICILVILFTSLNRIKADSPLTSTDFHVAYKDLPVFKDSLEMYGYILDDSVAVEKRLAVINRSGWDFNGKNHSSTLISILSQITEEKEFIGIIGNLSGYQLICLAYLNALDDYFNVETAMLIASAAEAKEPCSYAVRLIAALIKAQYASYDEWGAIYLGMDDVRQNKNLKMDMRPEASSKIFEYTDLYKEYVK